ncbi:hypothetical protein DVA67_012190 [Solirubrobacter sp. CPCC 204708]|uniref:Uncharacterized protein n=1 Tax=Solirubrobacter deserti TaxID=2282478 RepID=A0ABT4RLP6_9ACTN|nr:hypothetical protein [Solirubrobacter deserti]MBE2316737.1 hypothetical protein [Solirubrobacter deserti]MDA0139493.1 hypothetical protein [Solirubrobacter deserti]
MKRIMISAAAAIALLVAGCGTNDTFVRDFNEAQQPLQQLLADSAGASDAAKLGQLATGLEDTATRLNQLEAPADAQAEFAAFVKQVDASAQAVRGVQDAQRKPDQLADALSTLQQQMSRIVSAEQALKTAVDG